MYAIFWMVKKFEYELGGKKFKIETDHKVLVKFRNKQALKIIEITDGLKRCNSLILLLNIGTGRDMIIADVLSRVIHRKRKKRKK